MYLLDTVAVSESEKSTQNSGYAEFISSTPPTSKFLSVVTIGELHFGWNLLPSGLRKDSLESWITMTEREYVGRILKINEIIAANWGSLRAFTHRHGYAIEYNGLVIAATAIHHDLTVVTRNVRDFAPTGCKTLNPWENAEPQKSIMLRSNRYTKASA